MATLRIDASIFCTTMLKSVVFVLSSLIAVSSTNTCASKVRITQALLNEGFHRNISYKIVFNGDEDETSPLFDLQDCVVGLDQTLPAGVFANPDELGDLKRAKKIYVVPKNHINIEMPAEQSNPSSLFVMGTVKDDRADLWVPVHARYHQATSGGGMARNEVPHPRLFLRCPRVLPCAGPTASMPFLCDGSKDCWKTYMEIEYTTLTATLIWEVPVGNTDHYHAVASGTALVLVAGSLYLLKSVHQYKLATKRY